MNRERTLRLSEGVIAKTVGEELVLLDYGAGVYYGLDAIGGRIWQLASEGKPLGAIVDTLLEEYDVTRETLEADVEALVGDLTERGLVR
ncbi:MAG TPA: PqqD family protein [Thermoanaerobaculia bacterium]